MFKFSGGEKSEMKEIGKEINLTLLITVPLMITIHYFPFIIFSSLSFVLSNLSTFSSMQALIWPCLTQAHISQHVFMWTSRVSYPIII